MEEIRKELTREELEAQTVELLPDREEMQVTISQASAQAATVIGNANAAAG